MQDYIPVKKDINGYIDDVTVKQFDNGSRFLHVTISDDDLSDGDSFNIQGCAARMLVELGESSYEYIDGDIADAEGGIVTFLLPGSVTQTAGTYKCEIRITEPESGALISTKPFTLRVEESINADGAIEATPQYSALENALMLSGTLNSRMNGIDARMDSLTAMAETGEIPEGTVESEVIDARTGWNGTVYQSLGAAILGSAHESLSYLGTLLNAVTWGIYNSTFGGLPTNIFTVCNLDNSGGAISDAPYRGQLTGAIITLGRESKTRRANYDTQIFMPQTCEKIYARKYFDNAWSAWAVVGGSYLDAQIASVSQFREGVDDDSVRYHHHLYEVTDDGSFFASIRTVTVNGEEVARWNDLPASNQNFIITNTQYSTHWILQTAVPSGTVDVTFRRLIPRPDYDAEPRDWVRMSEMDTSKKILAVGDSICRGYRNGEKGFVGDLGLPYQNQGVSGATLSTARTDVTDIPTQLANYRTAHSDYSPDIIIANGGHNDYDNSAPLGDIPTQPAVSIEALNASTVMGGLQKLFLTMIREYPNAQRFFVTTHKIKKNNVYLVTERNSAGYSEQELHDAIVACCKVYNVRVIDIFNDSMLNSFFDEYRSGTNYIYSADDTYGENQAPIASASNNRTDYIDRDGVHPLPRGYLKGYVPLIREAIRIGTVKGSDT